jgi:hypothetical protein
MIARVGSCLVQEGDGLTVQRHVFSLESQVSNPSHILLAVAVIVFKEQVHRSGSVPQSSVQRDLSHIVGARKLNFLGRGKVSCSTEVKIVTIAKEFERPWRKRRVRCAYYYGVELDLTNEAIIMLAWGTISNSWLTVYA